MGLREFLTGWDGALVSAYGCPLEPIRSDWCDAPVEPVLGFGALWVCPACFGEAARAWNGRR